MLRPGSPRQEAPVLNPDRCKKETPSFTAGSGSFARLTAGFSPPGIPTHGDKTWRMPNAVDDTTAAIVRSARVAVRRFALDELTDRVAPEHLQDALLRLRDDLLDRRAAAGADPAT